jgi:hypothetical protein
MLEHPLIAALRERTDLVARGAAEAGITEEEWIRQVVLMDELEDMEVIEEAERRLSMDE